MLMQGSSKAPQHSGHASILISTISSIKRKGFRSRGPRISSSVYASPRARGAKVSANARISSDENGMAQGNASENDNATTSARVRSNSNRGRPANQDVNGIQ
ncbi:hypothetical protein Droror1_Dr00026480 [Drosera rotundifolia]